MKHILATGALSLSLGLAATGAFAQATTIPGEQVGLAVGAPLPEGVYAIDTFIYRSPSAPSSTLTGAADTSINVPVLVWSTPWTPLGGRLELLAAQPTVSAYGRAGGATGVRDLSVNVGTLLGGIWAFDLGNNFGVSLLGAVHLNDLDADRGVVRLNNGTFAGAPLLPQLSSNTYRIGFAGSYTGAGYNLTANLTYNFYDSPGKFDGANLPGFNTRGPFRISDALLLDLTATKKFDLFNEGKAKFEIGPVAYGAINLDPSATAGIFGTQSGRAGRFAVGGLIGYDFGKFSVQAIVATDVVSTVTYAQPITGITKTNYSTDGMFRVIVPLYNPPAPAPIAVVSKY
ncbi:transporter [Methylobacterium brachythecii]|uniref:CoxB-like protein n=1 Tax=Methylobacterium brachythecii TaxID=1176177 RepID=A0A7W6AK68_9HYPH|nr:transporter [Methylobacterium brachythecii]MBB3901277.1 hypothetical protein [Methylobacterium brachythecii]GLS45654.1 hypothetical protein GCM10007884_36450 [Methylobacterium brachythecii]